MPWRTITLTTALALGGCERGIDGVYQQVDGENVMEFRSDGSCSMTAFGATSAGRYEVDGRRIVLTFSTGAIVMTNHGETLEGGPNGTVYRKED